MHLYDVDKSQRTSLISTDEENESQWEAQGSYYFAEFIFPDFSRQNE